MTNMGIILPDDGYHERLRELTRAAGTLLIIDETHTFSAGPGRLHRGLGPGARPADDRQGDRQRRPVRARSGSPRRIADALLADPDADYEDTGGVGGTLAGNALSAAAMRATLEHVLTEEAFAHTVPLAERFAAGVEEVIARARAAVARDAARLPRRVRLRRAAAAQRHRGARGRRPRARALPAPARAQPRRDDHAVPQHGADVAGHERGRRRPSHRGVRGGRRRSCSPDARARARRPAPAAGPGADGEASCTSTRSCCSATSTARGSSRCGCSRIPRVGVHGNHDPGRPADGARGRGPARAPHLAAAGCPWPASRAACSTAAAGRTSTRSARRAKLARKLPAADVLIAHCPPAGINDDPDDPAHVGYEGLRDWVERHQPAPRPARPRPPDAGLGRRARRRHPGALGAGREGAAARLGRSAGSRCGPRRGRRGRSRRSSSARARRARPAPPGARPTRRRATRRRPSARARAGRRSPSVSVSRPSAAAARRSSSAISADSSRRTAAPSAANGPVPCGDLAEQDRPRVALALDEREDGEQAVPELLVGRGARVDAVAQRREQPRAGALPCRRGRGPPWSRSTRRPSAW